MFQVSVLFYSINYKEPSVQFKDVKLVVPSGLRELVENLAREILIEQPRNIPRFAANYFTAILSQKIGTVSF